MGEVLQLFRDPPQVAAKPRGIEMLVGQDCEIEIRPGVVVLYIGREPNIIEIYLEPGMAETWAAHLVAAAANARARG